MGINISDGCRRGAKGISHPLFVEELLGLQGLQLFHFELVSTLLLSRVPKIKIQEKSKISFCKILKNKWYHTKLLPKRFHFEASHHKISLTDSKTIPYPTLGVKGLNQPPLPLNFILLWQI